MSTKHTPGPWKMNGPTLVGNGYNIGSVNSHRTTEGEANANLISAAPELLEACERMANAKSLGEKNEARRLARLVIAKAKGHQ